MTGAGAYDPEQWRMFFSLLGTGAISLTGLVFVALTFNLKEIAHSATHRYRAISTLFGLTALFLQSCFALIGGQDLPLVGLELLIVAFGAEAYYIYGFVRIYREDRHISRSRLITGSILYLAEIGGASALLARFTMGLVVAGAAMTVLACFMISGAWLLVVGIYQDQTPR